MRRNLVGLTRQEYDLFVIGGGIYGISIARDAALRGLTVALVDQGDFGHATSSNHHKIIHGGLRYLQHGDLKRMRESIRERSILLRIAPHLVHPLPFLIPTYKQGLQGKVLMSIALKLNDLISLDRNRNLEPHKRIPRGRVISKTECLELCPDFDQRELTGGVLFFDGQVDNPNRLNLALLISAARAGADALNYVEATGFLRQQNQITGIHIKDVLRGDSWAVRARVVVNCAGPWTDRVLEPLASLKPSLTSLCKSVVLVTRQLISKIAVGIPSRFGYLDRDAVLKKGFRYFFITPWRNTSLVGTFQTPYNGEPEDLNVTEQEIDNAICEINAAFPAADLQRHDVISVLRGIVPGSDNFDRDGHVQLKKHHEIRDHAAEDGIEGLLSVMGVKYTTARNVAEKTVDLVFEKLHRKSPRCKTAETPVHGGAIDCFEEFYARALMTRPARIDVETAEHLAETYGAASEEILRYCSNEPVWSERVVSNSPVIKAEVLHAAREEMAQKLSDVIFRRTDLGTAGHPGDDALAACAEIMGKELGWSRQRIGKELQEVQSEFEGEHEKCGNL